MTKLVYFHTEDIFKLKLVQKKRPLLNRLLNIRTNTRHLVLFQLYILTYKIEFTI